jgi:hypothetical protein
MQAYCELQKNGNESVTAYFNVGLPSQHSRGRADWVKVLGLVLLRKG